MKKTLSTLSLYLFLLFLLTLPRGWAAVSSMSASPYSGGSSLSFSVTASSSSNREVTISVNATPGSQYQVFQRFLDPLRNENGIRLDSDALRASTLRGSSTQGTLNSPGSVSTSDQLLYTSGSTGESDSFVVSYRADGRDANAYGRFTGRIIYTVRPIGAGSQQSSVLNVDLQVTGHPQASIRTSGGSDFVRLNDRNQSTCKGYASIAVSDNLGSNLRIYQEVTQIPRDSSGEQVDRSCIKFNTSGGNYRSSTPLQANRILLYSGSPRSYTLTVNFEIDYDNEINQKFGVYDGVVRFYVEGYNLSKTFSVNLQADIKPIFEMTVDSPGPLHFTKVVPMTPVQTKELSIKVRSNLRKPYIVYQDAPTRLINDNGNEIPPQYFTYKGQLISGSVGKMNANFIPVPLGQNPVFFSDSAGNPAEIKLIYQLEPFMGIYAGNYMVALSFSLEER
ncbi:MAG: hypothetical protein JW734_09490 [Candidatus Omnitrophica bacterium]|nr:hypothetical protein [Candidatus Omnitrophota bacterium]